MTATLPPNATSPTGEGRLRWGFAFNLAGRGAVVVSGAGVSLLLARHYGAEAFGRWSVATAYATLVGTLLDGGFHRLMMRDVGRTPEAARQILWAVVKRRLQIAALATPLAMLAAAYTVGTSSTLLLVALVVSARVIWDIVGSFSSVLFAFEKFWLPNLVEGLRRASLLAAVLVIVLLDLPIEWAAIATLLLCLVGSRAIVKPAIALVADKQAIVEPSHWSHATWFWLNGVLFWINAEVDQLVLARLSGNHETGIYSAAVRLISLCLIIPRAVNDTVIRRWFRAREKADGQMLATTFLLAGVGCLLGTQFILFPTELIGLVYSSGFKEASPALGVLGWFLIFHFVRCAPHWFMSTSDRVPMATAFLGVAALVNLVANFILIPRYGALGSAYATAGSELLLVALAYVASGRTALKLVLSATLGALSTAAAVPVAIAIHPWSWFGAAVASLCVGAAALTLSLRWALPRLRHE